LFGISFFLVINFVSSFSGSYFSTPMWVLYFFWGMRVQMFEFEKKESPFSSWWLIMCLSYTYVHFLFINNKVFIFLFQIFLKTNSFQSFKVRVWHIKARWLDFWHCLKTFCLTLSDKKKVSVSSVFIILI
jgi:hypothetical protein